MICLRAVLVAVAMAAAPSALRALAAEPERFTPAPDAVGMQPPQAELGLQSILTQSYLQVSDGPLELDPAKAVVSVETLPAPAAAALPADTTGVPALADIAPSKPSIAPQVPGLAFDDRPEPLTLEDVLKSVLLSYPLLQAVERERGVAAGKLTSAMGAFDTKVNMAGQSLAPGTYENYRSDFGFSQQFMTGGISAFGGFRTGFGDFPTYNLGQKTADAGEWRGGLNIPLARDREIDRARATR
ncbi:MAG: hypothetical protein ACKO6B_02395, partial [Planctomycetia bacterium]